MKNIKKRLDYKNHIYVSANYAINPKDKIRIIYLHLTQKRLTLEYTFRVPYDITFENFHSRLIYNLPKRKLLEIYRKEKEYKR